MRQAYIATIQLCVDIETQAEACDLISELLSNNIEAESRILDWQYLKLGGQYLSPTSKIVADSGEYYEGDAFKD